MFQRHVFEQSFNPLGRSSGRESSESRIELHIFENSQRFVQGVLLWHNANSPFDRPRIDGWVYNEDGQFAAGPGNHSVDN